MAIQFDQPIVLQRSPIWSRAIVWGIIGVTTFSVLWACLARIEEAIPATGKLEPQEAVKEVKPPLNGVVKQVHVKDGQRVKQGDLLLTLDPEGAQSKLYSLKKVRDALQEENQYYRIVMADTTGASSTASAIASSTKGAAKIPPGLVALTKGRAALVAENKLYRSQLAKTPEANLDADQRIRLKAAQTETASRSATAQLEIQQLERQLAQNEVLRASAKSSFKITQQIYRDLEPVALEGGVSKIQLLKQKQDMQTQQAEAAKLDQENARLKLGVLQAKEKMRNTMAVSDQETLDKISTNSKQIAEIDSQLNKVMVENEKKIAESENELSQTKITLKYQEIRSPVDGSVFDLKATGEGFVADSQEPILKVVPDNNLRAKVSITNKDIGFIKQGMPVDIRVDSFPFSEFGDIKGQVVSVGSDALPPTQIQPLYTFPAKIQLDQQMLKTNGKDLPLQSGMSVSVNIKVRERPVISVLTDGFTQQLENLKFIR